MLVQPSAWSKPGTARTPFQGEQHRGPAAVGHCFVEIGLIWSLVAAQAQAEPAPLLLLLPLGRDGNSWVCARTRCPSLGGGNP